MYKLKAIEMLDLAVYVLLYSALRGKKDCYADCVWLLRKNVFFFFFLKKSKKTEKREVIGCFASSEQKLSKLLLRVRMCDICACLCFVLEPDWYVFCLSMPSRGIKILIRPIELLFCCCFNLCLPTRGDEGAWLYAGLVSSCSTRTSHWGVF